MMEIGEAGGETNDYPQRNEGPVATRVRTVAAGPFCALGPIGSLVRVTEDCSSKVEHSLKRGSSAKRGIPEVLRVNTQNRVGSRTSGVRVPTS